MMKRLLLMLSGAVMLTACQSGPISLYGDDLTGWHTDIPAADKKDDLEPSFAVRDGLLISNGSPQGHLLDTPRDAALGNLSPTRIVHHPTFSLWTALAMERTATAPKY